MNNIEKFDLLPKIVDNLYKRKVVYIGPTGTSGYASAAKGYLYELIRSNVNVKYIPYSTTSDKEVVDNTDFSLFLNKSKNIIINNPTEIVIHSIPSGWNSLLKNSDIQYNTNTKIIGRTVWEFEKVLPEWIDDINNSVVNIVSVPTQWNKDIFINAGITKPIVVEPHIYVNYHYHKHTFEHLLKKSILLNEKNVTAKDFSDYYKFYCISQLTSRKGIENTVESFCEAFNENDNVLLLLKTFRKNYSIEEQIKTVEYLKSLINKYPNHAPILYIKDELNYDEMKSFHDIGDCYFSLTKTEGFGLGGFDAFHSQKDIIVTGYGGHVEYLGNTHTGLVSYKLEPVNSELYTNCYLDDNYKWAIANKNIAIEMLQSKKIKKVSNISNNIILKSTDTSILYVGQYGTSGYATAAKQYIANYIMQNIPITWEPLYFDSSKLDNNYVNIIATSAINNNIKYNTVILHCTPDLWPIYLKENEKKYYGKKIIGYTVWETNILKPEWVNAINLVSEVWCPSKYNKEVFEKSGVTIPIKVVPHIFFPHRLPEKNQIIIKNAIEGYYTFYNISEYTERKNVKELLECYCQTFTKSDKVQLILKIHYKNYNNINCIYCKEEISSILKKYPNHAHIVVLYDNLTDQQILALHAYSDCYITLTRSEGFGLTIFEAYNYGKKIIATGYSGYIDFLGENYEGLIKYKLIQVKNMDNFNNNYNHVNQLWAQPDLDHAKNLMKMYYLKNI